MTEKDLCQSFSFRPATLFKKRLWHRCFPVNFVKFCRTLFFIEHLWWMLLTAKRCYFWKKISMVIARVGSKYTFGNEIISTKFSGYFLKWEIKTNIAENNFSKTRNIRKYLSPQSISVIWFRKWFTSFAFKTFRYSFRTNPCYSLKTQFQVNYFETQLTELN